MNVKEKQIAEAKERGRKDSAEFYESACTMSDADILANSNKVKKFVENGDYSSCDIGYPAKYEGVVYRLTQPYSGMSGNPTTLTDYWRECEEPMPEPTQLDMIEAQVMYTALMTDTLIEEDF